MKKVKLRAKVDAKEIEYKICVAKDEVLVTQGKGKNDSLSKKAKAARNDAREKCNKTEANLTDLSSPWPPHKVNCPPFPRTRNKSSQACRPRTELPTKRERLARPITRIF